MSFRYGIAFALSALLALPLMAAPASAQSPTFTPSAERPEDFPDAPGRELTFYACIPCHGFRLVAQQGQARWQWEQTVDLMTEKHGMPPIHGDLRKIVLDYLEEAFPPRTQPGGWVNPFTGK